MCVCTSSIRTTSGPCVLANPINIIVAPQPRSFPYFPVLTVPASLQVLTYILSSWGNLQSIVFNPGLLKIAKFYNRQPFQCWRVVSGCHGFDVWRLWLPCHCGKFYISCMIKLGDHRVKSVILIYVCYLIRNLAVQHHNLVNACWVHAAAAASIPPCSIYSIYLQ